MFIKNRYFQTMSNRNIYRGEGESLQLLIFSLYNVINIHKKVSFSLGIVIICNNEDDCRRVLSVLACMLLIPNGNHQKKVFVCRL